MFGYEVVVAFLVFIAGLLLLLYCLKRRMRITRRSVFAWLNNKALSGESKVFTATKENIFSCLGETVSQLDRPLKVVEIGNGAGSNFKFLPKDTEIICVEPNEFAKQYFLANVHKFPEVKLKEFHMGVAENMFFIPSESVDAVISTHVLCSVTDVEQTLKEIHRILKKGGKLIFLEHIEDVAGSSTRYWQHFFNRAWHFALDGCFLTRCTDVFIQNAGFDKTKIEIFNANFSQLPILVKPIVQLVSRHCAGVAIK